MVDIAKFRREADVIKAAQDGDTSPLAELIRSGGELSPRIRVIAARLVEGKSAKKRGEHRRVSATTQFVNDLKIAQEVKNVRAEKGVPLRSNKHQDGAFVIVARRIYGRDNAARSVEESWLRYRRCIDELDE